ncbi:hypothetical protein SCLCIDRAFT_1208225 [Scleroderma citrinum Foug A]|uniref:Uncharacterized protein n=1 Tax=Scleroderma citrinum Foug A TaxID=1036808 RepID=A0A0C3EPG4_9AGAM|nr:hypothetical protein SCLCIDRAFT_1208225 [Scleroderma citrinum Foug A]
MARDACVVFVLPTRVDLDFGYIQSVPPPTPPLWSVSSLSSPLRLLQGNPMSHISCIASVRLTGRLQACLDGPSHRTLLNSSKKLCQLFLLGVRDTMIELHLDQSQCERIGISSFRRCYSHCDPFPSRRFTG